MKTYFVSDWDRNIDATVAFNGYSAKPSIDATALYRGDRLYNELIFFISKALSRKALSQLSISTLKIFQSSQYSAILKSI